MAVESESDSEGFGRKVVGLEDATTGEKPPEFSDRFLNYIRPHVEFFHSYRTAQVIDTRVEQLAGDCARSSLRSQLLFPWESQDSWNPFRDLTHSIDPVEFLMHDGLTLANKIPDVIPAQRTLSLAGSKTFAGVIARAKHLPWPEQQSARRSKAVLRWRFIIEECLGSSKLGLQMQELMLTFKDNSEIQQVIEDTLHDKQH